ncbi:DNA-3-methyladenine glycosylase 2 family protein [Alteromonas sp. AMM-1]|uniref:DNA-3-methyladenine glycosylase 2 family protein n=1 Tax=Alteromonas sp. AMM-1 TaxID=3394233 RepID=UPI0039A4007C
MISEIQQQQYASARLSRDRRFDGQFYVAVLSTGIFCRPVCPARLPAEHNVRYFHFAQQALEQGFRPCLRCRPDSAPGSCAWQGVETTAKRALQLLSSDLAAPVTQIAERLGVSERYLNQLTHKAVGMPPKRYQLHSRLLQAKRLLQQTSLPVTDVAIACGFQSARRLQDTLQRWCKLSPSQLRGAQHSQPTNKLSLFLPVHMPYNWPQVRAFLALRAVQGVEYVDLGGYQRHCKDKYGVLSVSAYFNESKGGFDIQLTISNPAQIQPAITTLRRVLDMDTNPAVISQSLIATGLPADQLTPGLRLPGAWSVYEAGCRAIIGQQVSIKAAITQLNTLVAALGDNQEGQVYFPSPEALAASDLAMLRMPGARKQALRDFASLNNSYGDAIPSDEQILAIRGVGLWTLQYIKLRGDSEPDQFLSGDLIARRQAEGMGLGTELAAPWRSYLTIQLWLLASVQQAKSEQ